MSTLRASIERAEAAVKAYRKPPLDSGDVLVVLDPYALEKCCRIPSTPLFNASTVVQRLLEQNELGQVGTEQQSAIVPGDTSQATFQQAHHIRSQDSLDKVQYLLLLTPNTSPAEQGSPLESGPELSQTCRFVGPTLCNGLTQLPKMTGGNGLGQLQLWNTSRFEGSAGTDSHIKTESQGDTVHTARTVAQDCERSSWISAYESFFCLLMGSPVRMIKRASRQPLTGRISKTLQVAAYLQADFVVYHSIYDQLLTCDLWAAVASAPDSWLHIATMLKSRNIFEEAFIHIVGDDRPQYLEFIKTMLPNDLLEAVYRKRKELNERWDLLQRGLLLLTPQPANTPRASGLFSIQSVKRSDVTKKAVWAVWNHYISHHLRYFDNAQRQSNSICSVNDLCHGFGKCMSRAGFVRMLSSDTSDNTSNDIYMRPGAVELWADPKQNQRKALHRHLEELKSQVRQVAGSLESTLRLDANAQKELAYLTCVTVETDIIPWWTENDGIADDPMDIDEDDEQAVSEAESDDDVSTSSQAEADAESNSGGDEEEGEEPADGEQDEDGSGVEED